MLTYSLYANQISMKTNSKKFNAKERAGLTKIKRCISSKNRIGNNTCIERFRLDLLHLLETLAPVHISTLIWKFVAFFTAQRDLLSNFECSCRIIQKAGFQNFEQLGGTGRLHMSEKIFRPWFFWLLRVGVDLISLRRREVFEKRYLIQVPWRTPAIVVKCLFDTVVRF